MLSIISSRGEKKKNCQHAVLSFRALRYFFTFSPVERGVELSCLTFAHSAVDLRFVATLPRKDDDDGGGRGG